MPDLSPVATACVMDGEGQSPLPRRYGLEVVPENVEELVRHWTRERAIDLGLVLGLGIGAALWLTARPGARDLDLLTPTLYRIGLVMSPKILPNDIAHDAASALPILVCFYWTVAYVWVPLPAHPDAANAVAASVITDVLCCLSAPLWSRWPKMGVAGAACAAIMNCNLWSSRLSWSCMKTNLAQWGSAAIWWLVMLALRCYHRRRIQQELSRLNRCTERGPFAEVVPCADGESSQSSSTSAVVLPHVSHCEGTKYETRWAQPPQGSKESWLSGGTSTTARSGPIGSQTNDRQPHFP